MNPRNPQVIQKLFKKQKPNQSEFEEEYLLQESERNFQSKREDQEGWWIMKKNDERSQETCRDYWLWNKAFKVSL